MTIEKVKAEAKKRFGQDLTDEQAEAILKSDGSEELSAKALEEVTGGANNIKITYVNHIKPNDSELPRFFVPDFETMMRLSHLDDEAMKEALELLGQGLPIELIEAMLKDYGSGGLSAQELKDVAGGLHYELDVIHNGTPPGTINIYDTKDLLLQAMEKTRGGLGYKLNMPFPRDLLAKLESYAPDGPLKEWLDARSSEELSDLDLDGVAGGGCGSDDPATRDPEDDTPQNQQ